LLKAVEEAVRESVESGVILGYPLVDVRVALRDASTRPEESTEQAFRAATAIAMREAVSSAAPTLLEPVMDLEVLTREDFVGEVIGDLNSRRADIQSMVIRGEGERAVRCVVPLSEMFGYATDLRSLTQGRGTFTMEFDHHEPVPEDRLMELTGGYGVGTGR